MIKTVADRRTARFLRGQRVNDFHAFERQAQRRVAVLNEATCIEDLMRQPSNRFESLGGNRKGRYSIRINRKWRICFAFTKGDAYDVEIINYH